MKDEQGRVQLLKYEDIQDIHQKITNTEPAPPAAASLPIEEREGIKENTEKAPVDINLLGLTNDHNAPIDSSILFPSTLEVPSEESLFSVKEEVEPETPVEPIVEPEEPIVQPDPVVRELPPIPVGPQTPSDAPWLRLRAGALLGQYSSLQDPVAEIEENPLYSGTISFNNTMLGGADFTVDAWLPEQPWIGFDAKVMVGSYTVGWPAAAPGADSTEIPDFLPLVSINIQARYVYSEGGFSFYAAGKAGFLFSDFMRYTWKDLARTSVEYKALNATGASFGVELGGDTMNGDLFFSAGLTAGMLGISPYAILVDLEVGYTILPNVYGSLCFNQFSREIVVAHATTSTTWGTLSDNGWSLSAGVGFQY